MNANSAAQKTGRQKTVLYRQMIAAIIAATRRDTTISVKFASWEPGHRATTDYRTGANYGIDARGSLKDKVSPERLAGQDWLPWVAAIARSYCLSSVQGVRSPTTLPASTELAPQLSGCFCAITVNVSHRFRWFKREVKICQASSEACKGKRKLQYSERYEGWICTSLNPTANKRASKREG